MINLDRCPERLAWMTAVLSERGLSFERVRAVDWQTLSTHEIDEHRVERYILGPLPPGDIACFLSHRKCWESISQGGDDYVCVLEDDLHMSRDSAKFLSETGWIPNDADIVKIETYRQGITYRKAARLQVFDRAIVPLKSSHIGTAGYIVSRDCARRLLEMTEYFYDPVDGVMFNPAYGVSSELHIMQMVPALCIQDLHQQFDRKIAGLAGTIHRIGPSTRPKIRGYRKLMRELARPFRRQIRSIERAARSCRNYFGPVVSQEIAYKE